MRHIAAILACFLSVLPSLDAQDLFKKEAFSQSYNEPGDTLGRDTTDTMFSFKEFFGGVAHRRDARIGTLFAGSTVFIGAQQIHNRQYWKLPITYGGLAAGIGYGIHYRRQYNSSVRAYEAGNTLTIDNDAKRISNLCFGGAALIYWSTLLDGTAFYKPTGHINPGRSTIYSILLPGLGQAYNGEYWKVPIYWTCLGASWYFYTNNQLNYKRFKRIHNEATTEGSGYDGPYTAENALYYRNVYRRYRDYSFVALVGFYLLQVIDANVFAYMQDFELSDDLSIRMEPAVIAPDNAYAFGPAVTPAFGMRLGLTF
jgi:hypothetical protein